MTFVDMTNEEWEEVRRHHDEMVHMAELELRTDGIHEHRSMAGFQHSLKPVERQLRELDEILGNLPH